MDCSHRQIPLVRELIATRFTQDGPTARLARRTPDLTSQIQRGLEAGRRDPVASSSPTTAGVTNRSFRSRSSDPRGALPTLALRLRLSRGST
jgi:hypothetical protein